MHVHALNRGPHVVITFSHEEGPRLAYYSHWSEYFYLIFQHNSLMLLLFPKLCQHNVSRPSAHSTAFHIKDNPYLLCLAAIKFHNVTYTPTCHTRPTTAHGLHIFCIQDRPYLPCSVQQLHCSHPQLHSLSMHTYIHYTPSTTHPTAFHNPPMDTTNKHKA